MALRAQFKLVRVRKPRSPGPLQPIDFTKRALDPADVRPPRMPRMPRFKGLAAFRFPSLVPGTKPSAVYETIQEAEEAGAPPVPVWWRSQNPAGSDLEWMVYWWLSAHGVPFVYQFYGLGGRQQGDQVPDFYLPGSELLLDVQGEYWHYSSTKLRQAALVDKQQALQQGYRMVFLREIDLRQHLNGTMAAAIRGEQTFAD